MDPPGDDAHSFVVPEHDFNSISAGRANGRQDAGEEEGPSPVPQPERISNPPDFESSNAPHFDEKPVGSTGRRKRIRGRIDRSREHGDFIVSQGTGFHSPDVRPPRYDIEFDHRKPWTRYPMGYPRFAAFIANDEDKSTTIFRRFQRLSSRNILYLESELGDLEAEQDRLDEESREDDSLRGSMKSWNLLCLQATPPSDENLAMESAEEMEHRLRIQNAAQERLHLAWRIREVLKTYHEALKRESEVLAFSAPDRRPLKGTRKIFMPTYDVKEGTGKGAAMIHGTMRTHLDEVNKRDLCVLAAPVEQDRLTRLLEGRLSYFFRTKTEDGISDFVSHKRVSVAVSVISGLLATLFLIGAILGLYWVTSPNAKLGMLSGLVVGFAGSLALFTNARRQDVFAATAAYAAVLVVFVSGNLNTQSSTGLSAAVEPANISVSSTTVFFKTTSTVLATVVTTLSLTASSTSLPSQSPSPQPSSSGLSTPQIAGISVGVSLAVILLCLSGWFVIRRKRIRELTLEPVPLPPNTDYAPELQSPAFLSGLNETSNFRNFHPHEMPGSPKHQL